MGSDSDDGVRGRSTGIDEAVDDADEGPRGDGGGTPEPPEAHADTGTDEEDGHEWRFAVDDVGPDGVTEDTATPAAEPIEPESIDPEHAAFVVLGVVLALGVLLFGF